MPSSFFKILWQIMEPNSLNIFNLIGIKKIIKCYLLIMLASVSVTGTDQPVNLKDPSFEVKEKYDDDKNSMIAISETEPLDLYDDFYDEMDTRYDALQKDQFSMNILYFGPSDSFMRLGAETILHILSYTKKQFIPINRALQAWDLITDGKTAAFLQAREFLAFGSLLNVVPEEDLYYTNMGDITVLKFFANTKIALHPRKVIHYLTDFFLPDGSEAKRRLGILIAAYRRYFGDTWYFNGSSINQLGQLICGFPPSDLKKISPEVIKELTADVLGKLGGCSEKQLRTLYKTASHPDAYGDPYKWTSHEISRLDALFTCIPENDISSLQLEAIPAITADVMKAFEQRKLSYFTMQQIVRMQPATHRLYVLRTYLKNSLDVNDIAKRYAVINKPSITLLLSVAPFTLINYDCQ